MPMMALALVPSREKNRHGENRHGRNVKKKKKKKKTRVYAMKAPLARIVSRVRRNRTAARVMAEAEGRENVRSLRLRRCGAE